MSGERAVVVKIGTSSLTDERGDIVADVLDKVAHEVAALREAGRRVVIVTSGAIAAGLPLLGMDATNRPADAVTLQAASSVGQPELFRRWADALGRVGLVSGQILLAPHNFGDRRQYLHARSTLGRLLDLGAVPIVNENDAVTDEEIRYGDNDRIAALVGHMIDAEVLVLLTDTAGVLTADPRLDPDASLIEDILDVDQQLESLAGGAGTVRGSGGMASKLIAAKVASWAGVRTVIAAADRSDVVRDAVAGVEGVGTTVRPREAPLTARKLWIAFALPASATISVDAGARAALERGGTSLLAAGVTDSSGSFDRRDAIELADATGVVFAKGISRLDHTELSLVAGKASAELAPELPSLVVHTDDLIVMG